MIISSEMRLFVAILGMGIITYAIRVSFFALSGRVQLSDGIRQALRFVPPAVLSAIIVPELFMPQGVLDISFGNERLIAGLAAGLVAWFSKNVLVTVITGLVVLWILQALGV